HRTPAGRPLGLSPSEPNRPAREAPALPLDPGGRLGPARTIRPVPWPRPPGEKDLVPGTFVGTCWWRAAAPSPRNPESDNKNTDGRTGSNPRRRPGYDKRRIAHATVNETCIPCS